MFTCPVSAIESWIFDLLEIFLEARAMRLPVKTGGLLDQPLSVRRAFPIWESKISSYERQQQSEMQIAALGSLFGARQR